MASQTDTVKTDGDDVHQLEDNRGNNMLDEIDDLKRSHVDEFGAVTKKLSPLEVSLVRKMDWFCLVRRPSYLFNSGLSS